MRLYCFYRILLIALISFFLLKADAENTFDSVKIISLKNGNCVLALQKRRFYNAKPTLLPCKTAAFGMQNNRFCNALIANLLCNRYSCEKYLQLYKLLFVHKMGYFHKDSYCFTFISIVFYSHSMVAGGFEEMS